MSRQGIQTAINKSRKKCYKYLKPHEKKLVKIFENFVQADKFLYGAAGFYQSVKRLKNNAVDWDIINERLLNLFEQSNKAISKYNNTDKKELKKALAIFTSTQFKQSQSF